MPRRVTLKGGSVLVRQATHTTVQPLQQPQAGNKRIGPSLHSSRRSVACHFPHPQSEIEGARVNQQPLDDVGVVYPSDEPLWRMRAGMPDIGMDENWISGLPEPSDAASVHRAVLPDGRRCVREHL